MKVYFTIFTAALFSSIVGVLASKHGFDPSKDDLQAWNAKKGRLEAKFKKASKFEGETIQLQLNATINHISSLQAHQNQEITLAEYNRIRRERKNSNKFQKKILHNYPFYNKSMFRSGLNDVDLYSIYMPQAPVVHPYHMNLRDTTIRKNFGLPYFMYAAKLQGRAKDIFWEGFLKVSNGLRLQADSVETYIVVQDNPWENNPLILRPQSWVWPACPHRVNNVHFSQNANLDVAIVTEGYAQLVKPKTEHLIDNGSFLKLNFSVHNSITTKNPEGDASVISSGNTPVISGIKDNETNIFYSIVFSPALNRHAITLHVILDDKDLMSIEKEPPQTLTSLMESIEKINSTLPKVSRETIKGGKKPSNEEQKPSHQVTPLSRKLTEHMNLGFARKANQSVPTGWKLSHPDRVKLTQPGAGHIKLDGKGYEYYLKLPSQKEFSQSRLRLRFEAKSKHGGTKVEYWPTSKAASSSTIIEASPDFRVYEVELQIPENTTLNTLYLKTGSNSGGHLDELEFRNLSLEEGN